MKNLILSALALCFFSTAGNAKSVESFDNDGRVLVQYQAKKQKIAKHYKKQKFIKKHRKFFKSLPVHTIDTAIDAVSSTFGQVSSAIGRPLRFIRGHLICAINVNAALAARGIKGTGSALAKSFLHWGRGTSTPKAGDVIVFNRRGGGHVAIVSRVIGRKVLMWNPSARYQRWVETPMHRQPIGYRTM